VAERSPSRRGFDPVSLVLGLLLLAVPALYLVRDVADVDVDPRWVGPVVLIGAGLAGLLAALRGERPSAADAVEVERAPATPE
jgi:hypothetical protein